MIKINVKIPYGYKTGDLYDAALAVLPVEREEIRSLEILKRTLNLSDKNNFHYDMTLLLELSPERECGLLKMKKKVSPAPDLTLTVKEAHPSVRPVVIGAGPAGLFCALLLAEAGTRPIIFERGLSVDERKGKIDLFNQLGVLDTECNVQFGEGGAGAYSDGKLKYGAADKYNRKVLEEFVLAGAPEDILYSSGAHLGTDRLPSIVKKIREKIISLGGEVHFGARLTELFVKNGEITGGSVKTAGGESTFETDNLVLATGHSARDVFCLLKDAGAELLPKPFGIGLRIEHPREYIDRLIYGENAPTDIGAASYHLVTHLTGGRSVYSFCMCPGGSVVAASSEEGGIVTNGMSEYARAGDNSNAAFLVSVTPEDFGSDALSGIELQRKIEERAFLLSGSDYTAPSTTMGAFMTRAQGDIGSVRPTYPRGVTRHTPEEYLPDFVTDSIREAIPDFDAWLGGFYYPDAVMTGPETRSTSPLRVSRTDSCEAVGILGLYPTGEGAGYAGGIISSAVDGLRVAEKILEKYVK